MADEPRNERIPVDFPSIARGRDGSLYIARKPKVGAESDWSIELLNRYDCWRDLVDMPAAKQIEVEKQIGPPGRKLKGLPRADAIIWHSETSCSIFEAKTETAPCAIAGAIGQLLYYRALVTAYWGVKVEALCLAAPTLPPFILESIAEATAPIRFLKRDDADNLSGLVPKYALLP